MAINVYMTIFRRYNAHKLKKQEWKYFIMCYGLPFIVAFAYLFVETPDKGKIYGPAVVSIRPTYPEEDAYLMTSNGAP